MLYIQFSSFIFILNVTSFILKEDSGFESFSICQRNVKLHPFIHLSTSSWLYHSSLGHSMVPKNGNRLYSLTSAESDWIYTGACFIFSESKFAINCRRALKNVKNGFADASLFTSVLLPAMLQIDSDIIHLLLK